MTRKPGEDPTHGVEERLDRLTEQLVRTQAEVFKLSLRIAEITAVIARMRERSGADQQAAHRG